MSREPGPVHDLSHLPTRLIIYRGGRATPDQDGFTDLARGISWTTDRAIAAWFAVHYWGGRGPGTGQPPLVVERSVLRRQLLGWHNERGEREVVMVRAWPTRVEGADRPGPRPVTAEKIAEWTALADEVEARIRRGNTVTIEAPRATQH